jgi:hypothetical protein
MTNKIANVNISLPYKSPGNIIRHNAVSFDVYSEAGYYKAVPLLNEDERRIANLPNELLFNYENGKLASRRGSIDGNFHAIENIVHQLQKQKMI